MTWAWTMIAALTALAPGAGAPSAPPFDADRLVPIAPLVVPIIDANHVEGQLRIKLSVEMAESDAAETARAAPERLRGAVLAAVLDYARFHASVRTPPEPAQLARLVQRSLTRDSHAVRRVLIIDLRTRPAR